MGFLEKFLPKEDRTAAMLLYGMVLATCFNGYDAGIMTVILADEQFNEYYSMNANRQGIVAAAPWATTGLAQLFLGGTLAAWVGRLWALRLSVVLMCIGVYVPTPAQTLRGRINRDKLLPARLEYVPVYLSLESVIQVVPNTFGVMIFGRLVTGLGFGCVYIATNLYVAECSPRALRGSFVGTVSQFGYQLGTLIAFWAGYGMNFHKSPYNVAWRTSNLIQIPIGLFFVVISFWYPESPRWILEKNPDNSDKALSNLAFIRSGDRNEPRIRDEFHEMVASYEYRKRFEPGYLGLLKSSAMRKRLAYGFYATSLQQVGGIASLTNYAALIYQSLGWDSGRQALAINGIQAVLQLFVVLINTFTVDRYGRKQLLIVGFAIQALALLILSSLTTAFPDNNNSAAAVVEVAMIFIVGLTYCWSNGPITPAIASEIFPQHVRDKAFGISLLGQTSCLLAITQPWPRFNEQVGGLSYWLLFSLNTVALISVVIILPETKGISLERMDRIFGQIDTVEGGETEEGKHVHQMEDRTMQGETRAPADIEKDTTATHVEAAK